MKTTQAIRMALLLSAVALPVATRAADPASPEARLPPTVQSFVATGPSTDADLARLQTTLENLNGIVTVQVCRGYGGARLIVKGHVLYTTMAAAVKPVGFVMEPTPSRFFAASGPIEDADLAELRSAIGRVSGVDAVEMSSQPTGAALRVSGIAPTPEVAAAAKSAGFSLRQLGSYAVAGPAAEADLNRLRAALRKVSGVEQVEMQGLVGGATLLIFGDVKGSNLIQAARGVGYDLRPLANLPNPNLEYRINGPENASERQKLREALLHVDGVREVEIRMSSDGPRAVVVGDQLNPDRVGAVGGDAGFELTKVDNVILPSLTPVANRSTPPAWEEAIVGDPIQLGEAAPQFTLLGADGKSKISLSDYAGKKPVVLMFGSCSCPPFRAMVGGVEKLHQQYKDRVDFLMLYIREAHPGSVVSLPTQEGERELRVIPQTSTVSERLANLRQFVSLSGITMPAVVDDEKGSVRQAYASWPIRLYVVGTDGKIIYKGRQGPYGFRVSELAAWLRENAK